MYRVLLCFVFFYILGFNNACTSESQRVVILYTNNTNGNLTQCDCDEVSYGGVARRKHIIDSVRHYHPYVLLFDAGDILDAFGFRPLQDSLVLTLYSKMKYDAINIGDQEFANGETYFRKHILESDLPLLSSSIKIQNQFLTRKYINKTVAGITFGIIGYTPEAAFEYSPKRNELSLAFEEDLSALTDSLKPTADFIILLSQAGFEKDIELAQKYPFVDLIIGGHSQIELQNAYRQGETLILQAGGNGQHIGILEMTIRDKKIIDYRNTLIRLDDTVKEDAAFAAIIQAFNNSNKK